MKIAFACVENSCRSQMAEALAKKYYPNSGHEFYSFGTHPADQIDGEAIEALKLEGILWAGWNKTINDIDKPDVLITMGCGMTCPYVPGARVFDWDLEDPKSKEKETYQDTIQIIKSKLEKLFHTLNTKEEESERFNLKL